ncbi:hypothetical protein ACIA8G_35435 [Lentzea sp. NPDC051213]|uniref:hypothetical protein n=1 Tax=Lentzea sp. NPDC051213 TaxID=3364126 RepID=UPI0037A6DFAF
MKEFELERKIVDEVGKSLRPSGWRLKEAPLDSGFDVIATSPKGNLFPIEIKGGKGDLDVSTVVRFGSSVKDSTDSGKLDEYANLSSLTGKQIDEVGVKPLIVTSRQLPPATSDYASRLHIEVVTPEKLKFGDKTEVAHDEIGQLKERLLDSLKNWDTRIQDKKELGTDSAEPRSIPSWYRFKRPDE